MAANVLVVANLTAGSQHLLDALKAPRRAVADPHHARDAGVGAGARRARGGARAARRGARGHARRRPRGRRRDRRRRPDGGGRRVLRPGAPRRGDRLHAAGPQLEVAPARLPAPRRALHRRAGHARRGGRPAARARDEPGADARARAARPAVGAGVGRPPDSRARSRPLVARPSGSTSAIRRRTIQRLLRAAGGRARARRAGPGPDARVRRRRRADSSASPRCDHPAVAVRAAARRRAARPARSARARPAARSSSSTGASSWPASHEPTIRASSSSSAGSQPPPRRAPPARPRARRELRRVGRQRAPVGDPAGDDPERVGAAGRRRVRGEHEPRAGVGGAQDAAEPPEQRLQPARAAPQPGGALVALGGRRLRASAPRRAPAAPPRRRPRTGRAPGRAARGRGSGRGRRGRATGSGPSARRPTGAGARVSARPQWRRPNSELSCSTSSAAAARPRTGPTQTAWPAAGSRATSRIGNGMSSRQRR